MPLPSGPHQLTHQDTYPYAALPSARSIRILTLQPSTSTSAPLIGTLTIESLDSLLSSSEKPTGTGSSYETISYVWGTGRRTKSLLCDGQPIPITVSIYDALCRMRLPSRPRRLWADQICINQDDIQERSSQVRLMNEVYKGAVRILVWLGPDEHGVADDAASMVDHLHGVFSDEEAHGEFRHAHSVHLYKQNHEPWVPLAKLTRLPWFGRIWIVQEIGTGAPASLFWGAAELDWEKLSAVAGILNQQYHFLRSRFHISTPSIRYLYNRFVEPSDDYDENHNRGNFVYELHRARHLLACDPRDHIYAFLGHFSLQKGNLELQGFTADYSRPVGDVFCDVAVRVLKGATSLILLSATHNVVSDQRKPPFDQPDLRLPSWVPDWRVLPVHMIGSPVTPHEAAGTTRPKLSIDEDNRILHIHGIRIDTIRQRSWIFHSKAFQFRQARWGTSPLETMWKDICGYDLFGLEEKYKPFTTTTTTTTTTTKTTQNKDNPPPHELSAFYALIQTLSNACIGVDRSRPYADIPSKTWLANGASYLVKSGVQRSRISPQLLGHARTGDPFKWSHEATLVTRYRRFAVTTGGYYVMAPDSMEDGDLVVVLDGGKTPFVLRRLDDGDGQQGTDSYGIDEGKANHDGDGWTLVGECYVHGLMSGEAYTFPDVEPESFSIY